MSNITRTKNPCRLALVQANVVPAGLAATQRHQIRCCCLFCTRVAEKFIYMTISQGVWHKPTTEQELLEILASFTPSTKYRIVGGNTGTGVFKHDEESYDAFVDINHVAELKQQSQEPMVLGANVSITDAIHFFGAAGEQVDESDDLLTLFLLSGEGEPIFSEISHHLSLIASVGIKNQGTLAGNLMMKHAHQYFPSDVFLTLTTIGAMLEIVKVNEVMLHFQLVQQSPPA